jgi:hypothetical protein
LHALIIVRFVYIVKRRLKFFYAAQKTCFFVCTQRRNPGNGALYQCKNGRIPSFLVQPFGAGYLYRRMTTTVADLVFSRRRILHASRRARRPSKGEHQHLRRSLPAAGRAAKTRGEKAARTPGGVFAAGLVCVE